MSDGRSRLIAALRDCAAIRTCPDGTQYTTLDGESLRFLALEHGLSLRKVEIIALGNELVPLRYLRNFSYFSLQEQITFLSTHILIVGLGGLGGVVLETAARLGIGIITAVDGDVFDESNLNRQLLSHTANTGMSKAEVAQERVRSINPAVELTTLNCFADASLFAELLSRTDPAPSAAVDALDNPESRKALQQAACDAGVSVITASVAGFSGVVAVVHPGRPGPTEFMGNGTGRQEYAEHTLGSPSPVVYTAAALQTSLLTRLVLKRPIKDTTLFFDLSDLDFQKVNLSG